ncbi:esterase family protein [Nocardia asteroides NBRC 15531]|uniref:Mycolyltransferase n=1 Tax=Nocardia asteroides NBRC 15531 TaxID=1110697 RepID=U5EJ53_NOCAS|nr:esterase family protein [Nocardia asteroides NBRC 15531]GAD86431.1 putative mycolyltransferase [Nocardia asteroides NBRC 15531]SFM19634.1 S-formylglutathione hydrolase FrmB [Nocardia asteroides]VEG35409.1 Mycolyl transferase 85A [Nocardia asteroides]
MGTSRSACTNTRFRLAAASVAVAAVAGLATTAGPAVAEPSNGVVAVRDVGERHEVVSVYSAAMDRSIPVQVVRAAEAQRPTLYLLNGSQGGPNGSGWDAQTDVVDFLRGRDVNVVTPVGGSSSYYTDWVADDPVLGRNKWQTFINEELPPVIENFLGANDERALAGVSMSGTSVLNLAIAKPGFWRSVASYSGCAQTSDPIGQEFVRITVENWGGGRSVENMWGPRNGPLWRANDPFVNAERLRGTAVYLSTGSGVPAAPHDTPADPRVQDGRIPLAAQVLVGGPIEAAVRFCTVNLANRLGELNIPVTLDDRPVGTHSWGYWEDDLRRSWPFLAESIGASR